MSAIIVLYIRKKSITKSFYTNIVCFIEPIKTIQPCTIKIKRKFGVLEGCVRSGLETRIKNVGKKNIINLDQTTYIFLLPLYIRTILALTSSVHFPKKKKLKEGIFISPNICQLRNYLQFETKINVKKRSSLFVI